MTRNCINVYVPNLRTECREGRLRSIRSLPSTMETENRERHEDVASLGYRDRNMNDKALLWNATLSRSLGRTNQFTLKLDAHDILRRTSSVRYTLNAMGQSETGHRTTASVGLYCPSPTAGTSPGEALVSAPLATASTTYPTTERRTVCRTLPSISTGGPATQRNRSSRWLPDSLIFPEKRTGTPPSPTFFGIL